MKKECSAIDKATFPSIWKPAKDEHGGGKGKAVHFISNLLLVTILTDGSYDHVVSGERQDDLPLLLRGGILADVSDPFRTWRGLVLTL